MNELASNEPNVASALCGRLADEYEDWISGREREIEERSDLSARTEGDRANAHGQLPRVPPSHAGR